MVHTVLITLHAIAGVVAFALGWLVIRPPAAATSTRFRLYLGSMFAMTGFVILSVIVGWGGFGVPERVAFAGLCVLAVFMTWRAWQARVVALGGVATGQHAYIGHVGFTLISLFDGFVIVGAIDLGAPVWLVVAIAVAGVGIGHILINRVHATASAPAS
jgi:hypothetical protein